MTQLLFLEDPYLQTFQAKVVDCQPEGDQFAIVLDRTAFYPEGGGQPWDVGSLNNTPVGAVIKEGKTVRHLCPTPLHVGDIVQGQLNWQHRLELMQQHTGQHMISSAAWKLYTAKTVGFHLTLSNLTIDLDKALTPTQMKAIESQANQWIWENHQIKAHYPSSDDLESMNLRKMPKVKEDIRIIEIEGVDLTPCGGTHLHRTGEIGLIKIRKTERYKGGTRLYFAAGMRALEDYRELNQIVGDLVAEAKVPAQDLVQTFVKNADTLKETKKSYRLLQTQLSLVETKDLLHGAVDHPEGYKIIRKAFDNRDMGALRAMANSLTKDQACVVLLGTIEDQSTKLLFARTNNLTQVDVKEIFTPAIEALGGRGGGNSQSAQGGGGHPEKLAAVLQDAMDALLDI